MLSLFSKFFKSGCALLLGAVVALSPSVSLASVFGPPGHVLVRSVKPSDDAQLFKLGLNFEIAPIKAVAKKAVGDLVEGNDDLKALSEVLADPRAAEALEEIRNLDASETAKMKQKLKELPGVESEEQEAIDGLNDEKIKMALDLADLLQEREEAVAFSIRPSATLNFPAVQLRTEIPMAVFESGGEFYREWGNLNLDTKFGHTFGSADIGLGISYGLHTYFPTGTDADDTLAYTNVLNAPIYMHEYLTTAPYAVVGADLFMARVSAHAEIVPMFGVRGDPEVDKQVYFRYGAGVLVNLLLVTLHGEMVGATSIENAEAFEGTYAITGVTFGGSLVHVGLCAQLRMSEPGGADNVESVDMDTNFIATLGMGL